MKKFFQMLRGYLASFIAKYLFTLFGGIFAFVGISEESLVKIIIAILSLIIGGSVDISSYIKARNDLPLKK